jgi:hypothetical protein
MGLDDYRVHASRLSAGISPVGSWESIAFPFELSVSSIFWSRAFERSKVDSCRAKTALIRISKLNTKHRLPPHQSCGPSLYRNMLQRSLSTLHSPVLCTPVHKKAPPPPHKLITIMHCLITILPSLITTKHSPPTAPKYTKSQPHPSNTSSSLTSSSSKPWKIPSGKRSPSWDRDPAIPRGRGQWRPPETGDEVDEFVAGGGGVADDVGAADALEAVG